MGQTLKTKLSRAYNFVFNNEEFIDLNDRLDGIFKKEPSEDILV